MKADHRWKSWWRLGLLVCRPSFLILAILVIYNWKSWKNGLNFNNLYWMQLIRYKILDLMFKNFLLILPVHGHYSMVMLFLYFKEIIWARNLICSGIWDYSLVKIIFGVSRRPNLEGIIDKICLICRTPLIRKFSWYQ